LRALWLWAPNKTVCNIDFLSGVQMKWKLALFSIIFFLILFYFTYTSPKENITVYKNTVEDIQKDEYLHESSTIETPKINIQQCKEFLKPNHNVKIWRQEKKYYIKNLLINLKQIGMSEFILDNASINTGIGLYRGRILRNKPDSHRLPHYHDGSSKLASYDETLLIDEIIANKNYQKILPEITKNKLRSNIFVADKDGLTYLFSYFLNADRANIDKLIPILVDAGVEIQYADLILVTKLGGSITALELMINASSLKIDKVLSRFGRYTSFVLVALESKNTELASFWIENGSILELDQFSPNAIDLLVKHKSSFNNKQFLQMFYKIMEYNIHPNLDETSRKLKLLLSNEDFYNYKRILSEKSIPKIQMEEIRDIESDIYKNVLRGIVTFNLDSINKHECFSALGKSLIKTLSSNDIEKSEVALEAKSSFKNTVQNSLKNANKFNSIEDITSFYGSNESLEVQQEIELFKIKKIGELASKIKKDLEMSENNIDKQELMKEILKLANLGRWDEVISLLNSISISTQEIANTLLIIAINTDSDFYVIKRFIDDGATLLPEMISILIKNNNIKLAYNLLDYGLTINYIDLMGYSTITQSVKYNSFSMLQFLIDNGAEINSYSGGYDALDLALIKLLTYSKDYSYVDILILNGINIKKSHKQLAEKLRNEDFASYVELINRYPSLR
jgi:hypothetical protein